MLTSAGRWNLKRKKKMTSPIWLLGTAKRQEAEKGRDPPFRSKTDQHFTDASMINEESCPLCCKSRHLLASCHVYQESNLKQRWEIVRQNRRCQKCPRVSPHTKDRKTADGTSCDKCKRRHHEPLQSTLSPDAPIFRGQGTPSVFSLEQQHPRKG